MIISQSETVFCHLLTTVSPNFLGIFFVFFAAMIVKLQVPLLLRIITCWLAIFQTQRDIIFELRRIAFDGENDPTGTEKRKAMYTKDYKMLGFTVSPCYRPQFL